MSIIAKSSHPYLLYVTEMHDLSKNYTQLNWMVIVLSHCAKVQKYMRSKKVSNFLICGATLQIY